MSVSVIRTQACRWARGSVALPWPRLTSPQPRSPARLQQPHLIALSTPVLKQKNVYMFSLNLWPNVFGYGSWAWRRTWRAGWGRGGDSQVCTFHSRCHRGTLHSAGRPGHSFQQNGTSGQKSAPEGTPHSPPLGWLSPPCVDIWEGYVI